eukprot:CAMPEP_0173165276 /NCGR_PEP_ID=MMETSP1105-20130129/21225_1 /TAXON_ID=2985 /ORGANISM="Ochromonas sp., Strain BG-1" /LENGTH=55 /DNA_ID=CAMNT_0014086103 /DNA_START=90 /DNA_END=257 /DNA_ORIENTATION=+
MVNGQLGGRKSLATVLAGIVIAKKDIFLSDEGNEVLVVEVVSEHDDTGQLHREGD